MNHKETEKLEDKVRRKNEDPRSRQAVNWFSQQILPKIQPFLVLEYHKKTSSFERTIFRKVILHQLINT